MVPSVLTAVLFAASGICGRRAAVALGAMRANACRLALACLLLGCWVWLREPVDFAARSVRQLLYSGVIGFGMGDACLFLAYPRIGARLTILVNLCSAPVFGAVVDWLLSGTAPSAGQGLASLVIVSGVVLALLAGRRVELKLPRAAGEQVSGVVCALFAGLGQGCGAALSRRAHAAMVEDGVVLSGVAQAFVRTLPGVGFAMLLWLAASWLRRPGVRAGAGRGWWGWMLGAVLCGPVMGVSCFQWALSLESSVVVLSVTATAPVLIMPMAVLVDRDRLTWPSVFGAVIAVLGVVLMLRLTHV